MKKYLISFLALCLAYTGFTQGMDFDQSTSWEAVKAKAKAQNKYIFMDTYTTWCGPCKQMSANIFPQAAVGDFYNKNFINLKVQIDSTGNDDEHVKTWRRDAKFIEKEYKVMAYPTYLIFNPQGELVHRLVGSMEADKFIEEGKKSLNPETQFYVQLNKYKAVMQNADFLRNLVNLAGSAYESNTAAAILPHYLATQKDLYTKENLELLRSFTQSTRDTGFKMAISNPQKIDDVLGAGTASRMMMQPLYADEIMPRLQKDRNANLDNIENEIIAKYPAAATPAKSMLNSMRLRMFQQKQDWSGFATQVDKNIESDKDVAAASLNSAAWTIFENVDDKAILTKALAWSKLSLDKDSQASYMDTYANLLYKLGRKKEARNMQQNAINTAKKAGEDIGDLTETLQKMKKGQKTWE